MSNKSPYFEAEMLPHLCPVQPEERPDLGVAAEPGQGVAGELGLANHEEAPSETQEQIESKDKTNANRKKQC